MPVTLLPASAAAFAPRGLVNVVLNKKPEPWLTLALKRINRVKRPLNSVAQHHRCLTETLSAPTAIWTLCSLLLQKTPEADQRKDENPLVEALFNYQWTHVEAYVVHVDMVSQNEVAFKLTPDTIEALVEYHKDIWSVDEAAKTHDWTEKEVQLKKLQENFVQAINRFVFRTSAHALEGIEEDGAGELLAGGAEEVKTQILGMFQSLMPPPPRQPDVIRPAPILPSSAGSETWWPSSMVSAQQSQHDPWRNVSSSPTPSNSGESYPPPTWNNMTFCEPQHFNETQLFSEPHRLSPSPAYDSPASYGSSAYSPPCTTAGFSAAEYFTMPVACEPYSMPIQYPSMLVSQCGVSAGLGGYGNLNGFSSGYPGCFSYSDFSMPMPSMAYAAM